METKSVLCPRPVARMATSSTSAAQLKRKTATTTSSIPGAMAKYHAAGRRLILSLIPRIPSYLSHGVLIVYDTVEGSANLGLTVSAECPKVAGNGGCYGQNSPTGVRSIRGGGGL